MSKVFECSSCKKTIEHPEDSCSTGYGIDKNGNKICFACCGEQDKERMAKEGKITLYLTKKDSGQYQITNWPGSLAFTVAFSRKGRHNIGGTRTDVWFRGPDSAIWHGWSAGGNTTLCHCKRTKKTDF